VLTDRNQGIPPRALQWIVNTDMRGFVERCIGRADQRPSASALLSDPFLNTVAAYDDEPCGTFGASGPRGCAAEAEG
jgi:hypothetical protein